MQEEFINQILFRINENPPRVERCLSLLSEEQVWIKHASNGYSIGNLILHLCGNVTQYAISSLGGRKDVRERDQEFSADGSHSKQELKDLFRSTLEQASEVIQNVTNEELLKVRSVQGFQLSGIGILIHVTEHLSYHVGQISTLTKIMSNADLGYYENLDLSAKNND